MSGQRRQSGFKSGVMDPGKNSNISMHISKKVSIFPGKNFRRPF